tara:strand:- start:1183 stop:2727 length:1545 start_codon:yes stop_codon:yes gene_type:complete
MTPISIHPAFLRDSEKKGKNDLPGPDAQVWIYTEPGVKRKLATVVDPKMIDSRILHSITIPPNALFTARFNKEDAAEERRLREWPDDSQWSPDEFVSVLNDKNWQWYYTEPRSFKEVWEEVLPSSGQQVWVYKKPGVKGELATVVDPKMINSRVRDRITIPPHALFTAWINNNSEYVAVLKDENWEWYSPSLRAEGARGDEVWVDHPMSQSGPPAGSAGTMPFWRKPAKKIVDLKDIIQIEVDKQLNDNIQLKKFNAQNELIEKQKKEIKELKEMMIMERKCMQFEIDDAEQEIETLTKENKEMTGSLVKAQWLIEKIKDVKGFTDTGASIAESFEYIDFPETEKEEFVATSYTDSVVEASTTREDREFYGEDFHEEEPTTLPDEDIPTVPDEENFSTVHPLTPRRSLRINLSQLFDRLESRRSLTPRQSWILRYNTVEDTTVFPDEPELPWYEARYPTPTEIEAARTIQRIFRTVRGTPNNDIDISPWPREMEYVDAIREFLNPELNCEERYP